MYNFMSWFHSTLSVHWCPDSTQLMSWFHSIVQVSLFPFVCSWLATICPLPCEISTKSLVSGTTSTWCSLTKRRGATLNNRCDHWISYCLKCTLVPRPPLFFATLPLLLYRTQTKEQKTGDVLEWDYPEILVGLPTRNFTLHVALFILCAGDRFVEERRSKVSEKSFY